MKFSTNLTLTTTTLLLTLCLNDVYGAPTNGPKHDDVKATSTSTGTTGNLRSTANLALAEEDILLGASYVFVQQKDDKPLFTYSSYDIGHGNRAKLGHAKDLVQLAFNGVPLEFEDQAKLPNRDGWLAFAVFANQDNKPVILRIKVADGDKNFHYHYLLDSETGKFKNTAVKFVDEEAEEDNQGLTRHNVPMVSTAISEFSERVAEQWEELSEGAAKDDEAEEPLVDSFVQLTIVPSGESIKEELDQQNALSEDEDDEEDENSAKLRTNFVFVQQQDGEVLFTYTSYEINKENQAKIADSLEVPRLAFNGVPLEFEDQAKLPNRDGWRFLFLFANQNNDPVMLVFKVVDGDKNFHYHYLLDSETKKFKNVGLDFVDEEAEEDNQGLTRHSAPVLVLSTKYLGNKLAEKWPEMFKGLPHPRLLADKSHAKSFIELTLVPSGNPIKVPEVQAVQQAPANFVTLKLGDVEVELEANFDYTHQKDDKSLLTYTSYKIDHSDRNKLGRSNEEPQLSLNGKDLVFKDGAKLPNPAKWVSLVLLADEDGQTVMLRIKVADGDKNFHYYFGADDQTKKLRNTAVKFVDEEEEKDEDGLIRYPEPVLVKARQFCQNVEQQL